MGRSTASKVLLTLEQRGLAARTPGGHDGTRRSPDLWHPLHIRTDSEENSDAGDTEPESSATDIPEPPHDTPEAPKASIEASDATTTPAAAEQTEDNDSTGNNERETANAPESTSAAAAPKAERPTSPATTNLPPDNQRLAPGGLRQLVLEHLQAHPTQTFTATKISRLIHRSSGAIANALDKLTRQGLADVASEPPRTYRLSPTAEHRPPQQ